MLLNRRTRRAAISCTTVLVATMANTAFTGFAAMLEIPLFLNSFFTVLVTIVQGPLAGTVVAVLTHTALEAADFVRFPFVLHHVALVWIVHALELAYRELSLGRFVVAGLLTGLTATIIGSVISITLYGGTSGDAHLIDYIIRGVAGGDSPQPWQTGTAVLTVHVADKLITFISAFIAMQAPPLRFARAISGL